MKFTKKSVAALKPPTAGQVFAWDDEVKGFGVRVTAAGAKSWIVQYQAPGRSSKTRATIGAVSEIELDTARSKAIDLKLGRGDDTRSPARLPLLKEVWTDYKRARVELKPRTIRDYEKILSIYISDWQLLPLNAITPEMIQTRHLKIGATNKSWANYTSRLVRALFNFAEINYPVCTGLSNPVRVLTRSRGWYKIHRRQTRVKSHEMATIYSAITEAVTSETIRDYFLLIFFTGYRPTEAATLRWEHVDIPDRSLLFPDPKNRTQVSLPVGRRVAEMLEVRRINKLGSPWVFPGNTKAGHVGEPKKQIANIRVASLIHFTPTHLRRTFATITRSMGIPNEILKKFMTHRSGAVATDVTDGYVADEIETLRPYIQKIEDHLMELVAAAPLPLKRGEQRVGFFDSEAGTFEAGLGVPVDELLKPS